MGDDDAVATVQMDPGGMMETFNMALKRKREAIERKDKGKGSQQVQDGQSNGDGGNVVDCAEDGGGDAENKRQKAIGGENRPKPAKVILCSSDGETLISFESVDEARSVMEFTELRFARLLDARHENQPFYWKLLDREDEMNNQDEMEKEKPEQEQSENEEHSTNTESHRSIITLPDHADEMFLAPEYGSKRVELCKSDDTTEPVAVFENILAACYVTEMSMFRLVELIKRGAQPTSNFFWKFSPAPKEGQRRNRRGIEIEKVCPETGERIEVYPTRNIAAEAAGCSPIYLSNIMRRGDKAIYKGFLWRKTAKGLRVSKGWTKTSNYSRPVPVLKICPNTGDLLEVVPSQNAAAGMAKESQPCFRRALLKGPVHSAGFVWRIATKEAVDEVERRTSGEADDVLTHPPSVTQTGISHSPGRASDSNSSSADEDDAATKRGNVHGAVGSTKSEASERVTNNLTSEYEI